MSVALPNVVVEQIMKLREMGHPMPMSVSSTQYVAREYGLTELADFLEEGKNATDYLCYIAKNGLM